MRKKYSFAFELPMNSRILGRVEYKITSELRMFYKRCEEYAKGKIDKDCWKYKAMVRCGERSPVIRKMVYDWEQYKNQTESGTRDKKDKPPRPW